MGVQATSYNGSILTGAVTFSHDVPAPTAIIYPALAEDEENAGEALVSIDDLMIEWADVTKTVDGGPLTITAYKVIITKVEHDSPHSLSQPIFDVHVPADRNTLTVPVEFLEPDTVYELEVLALEESGNQTISIGFFQTDEGIASSDNPSFLMMCWRSSSITRRPGTWAFMSSSMPWPGRRHAVEPDDSDAQDSGGPSGYLT